MTDYKLTASSREDQGKGASRRLRRLADQVPAIVYGGKKKPASISVPHKDIKHALENEAFYSHIVELDIEGKSEDVILKDVQRHPSKPLILHLDFLRVSKNQKLTVRVPLHFINEDTSKGVKLQGGVVTHNMTELEVSCLPANLPEYIEVDLAEVEVDQIVHISDITLPEGVESVDLSHGEGHDQAVAAIHVPKVVEVEENAPEAPETEVGDDADGDKAGEGDED